MANRKLQRSEHFLAWHGRTRLTTTEAFDTDDTQATDVANNHPEPPLFPTDETMAKERSDKKAKPADKKRKGFSVGPANLPDGVYKRKVTKIKQRLIHKAKVKKQYNKTLAAAPIDPAVDPNAARALKLLKEAEQERLQRLQKGKTAATEAAEGEDAEAESLAVHPDRQAALDRGPSPPPQSPVKTGRRVGKPKTSAYKKEESFAAKQKREREEAARFAEERKKEREKRIKEREMTKKMMSAKTKTGQLKLGKQSHVLLKKVMEQMGKS
jgi:hypothetical protein